MPEIRGLSLTQPWAQLVVLGEKQYETRSWSTKYRGLLAIHASKGFPVSAQDLLKEEPFLSVLNCYAHDLKLGAIIGTVEIQDCCLTELQCDCPRTIHSGTMDNHSFQPVSSKEQAFGDWTPGRYAWRLRNPKWLPKPIPCKGSLGLWQVPAEIHATLLALRM